MAAAKSSPSATTTQVASDMGIIKYQVGELQKGQERMEQKLDLINYVPTTIYDAHREADAKIYATKKDIEPLTELIKSGRRVIWAIITVFAIAVATFAINGGFTK